MSYVDLQRRFLTLADDREETLAQLEAARLLGHADTDWAGVLDCSRVVLLAEAGAGKTEELRAQRDRLQANGHFAIVLPVEDLAGGGLQDCCTPRELAAFEAWLSDVSIEQDETTQRGWFFLDAVDEAKLTGKRFSTALNKLAHALGAARDRAHVVITSRVSDWRPGADLREVEERLPPPRPQGDLATEAVTDVFLENDTSMVRRTLEDEPTLAKGVRLVALASLNREQVERLSREGAGLDDTDAFLRALDDADLWDLVSRPLDALDLARFWHEHRRLESRAGTLNWIIDKRLTETNPTHERVPGAPAPSQARRYAARLAAALTFTRRRTIALPDADRSISEADCIDPGELLPDLNRSELHRLLSTALFDPASYGRVRFHHREVEEFLTADWLYARLTAGMQHGEALDLLLPTRAGLRVAPETLRPALAWLALRDERIFAAALEHAPAVLLQHGDPGSLPLVTREQLLEAYAARSGDAPWAEVDATVVSRLARPDLANVIRTLWPPGVARSALRDLITIAIGRGRILACADLVVSLAVAHDANEVSRIFAIDAVAQLNDQSSIETVLAALREGGNAAPWRVVAEAIEQFFPHRMSTSECLALLPALQEKSDGYIGRIDAGLVDGAETAIPTGDLRAFAHGLSEFLKRDTKRGFRRILLAFLTPVSARLARELTVFDLKDAETIALVLSRRGSVSIREADRAAIEAAVEKRPDLRAALFRAAITLQTEIKQHAPDVFWHLEDRPYSVHDVHWLKRFLGSDEPYELRIAALRALVGLSNRDPDSISRATIEEAIDDSPDLLCKLTAWTATEPSDLQARHAARNAAYERKQAEEEAKRKAWRAEFKVKLAAALEDPSFSPNLLLGEKDNLLVQAWKIMQGRENAVIPHDWKAFEGALGTEGAERLRDTFIARWRTWSISLRAEGRETCRYGDSIAATGLLLNLERDAGLLHKLQRTEAEQALRIGLFENLAGDLALAPIVETYSDLVHDLLHRELRYCLDAEDTRILLRLTDPQNTLFVAIVADELVFTLETRNNLSTHVREAIVNAVGVAPQPTRLQLGAIALARLSTAVTEAETSFWWRVAFANSAAAAMRRLEAELAHTDPVGRCGLMGCVLPAMHTHEDRLNLGIFVEDERFNILSRLVELAFEYTPPEAYPDRWNRPGFGDDEDGFSRRMPEVGIGDAREALFNAIVEVPGAETVATFLVLADRFAGEPFVHRFRRAAVRRATADAEPGWTARDVVQVEREQDIVPRTGDQLFAFTVRRLDGIARDLVDADFSDGPLLALLDRPPDTDEAAWPREREKVIQAWAAKQLRDRARERYSVFREAEVADQKEPDILVSGRDGCPAEVAVEIKIADDWSMRQLKDALLVQLCEQYLRPKDRRHGVLLLVHLDPDRSWHGPEGGDSMTFDDLVLRLAALAEETRTNASGAVALSVKSIDAARFVEKARALREKASNRGKRGKARQRSKS